VDPNSASFAKVVDGMRAVAAWKVPQDVGGVTLPETVSRRSVTMLSKIVEAN